MYSFTWLKSKNYCIKIESLSQQISMKIYHLRTCIYMYMYAIIQNIHIFHTL